MLDSKIIPHIVINPIRIHTVLALAGVFFLILHYLLKFNTGFAGWALIVLAVILVIINNKKKPNFNKKTE